MAAPDGKADPPVLTARNEPDRPTLGQPFVDSLWSVCLTMRIAERLEFIRTPSSWTDLCPKLTVGGRDSAGDQGYRPGEPAVQRLLADLHHDGYFRAEAVLSADRAADLVDAVARIRQLELPPVFVFVFDEAWAIVGRMRPVLSRALGDGHRVLPSLWAWWLDPSRSEAGWRPHRDRDVNTVDESGHPQTLTLWAALTDATPDNGCIYVLPAASDPNYRRQPRVCTADNLPDIRALPAAAGSVLGWNHALLHWGGRSNPRAARPRVSLAFELARADAPDLEQPLLDPAQPPDFTGRLQLIGGQMLKYQHMHPLSDALEELAAALTE